MLRSFVDIVDFAPRLVVSASFRHSLEQGRQQKTKKPSPDSASSSAEIPGKGHSGTVKAGKKLSS